MTSRHRRAFLFNAALLSMHMSKSDQCKEILATLRKEFPDSDAPALIQAANLARAKQPAQAEAVLAAAAADPKRSDPSVGLTLAQLQLRAKDMRAAAATLRGIECLQNEPALIGTLVALYEKLGDIDAAADVLSAAGGASAAAAAASFFGKYAKWAEAAEACRRQLAASPRNLHAMAGLVIATSHFDAAAANEHLARLEMAAPMVADDDAVEVTEEDAERLEQVGLPRAPREKAGSPAGRRKRELEGEAGGAADRPKRKRRRRKKPRYPKGFDPENPGPMPDPERWLPKRERSTYRARKKDRRAGVSRGPQGSTSGQANVKARVETNIKLLTDEEKAKAKAEADARARLEAAQAAAQAAGKKKKGKK